MFQWLTASSDISFYGVIFFIALFVVGFLILLEKRPYFFYRTKK